MNKPQEHPEHLDGRRKEARHLAIRLLSLPVRAVIGVATFPGRFAERLDELGQAHKALNESLWQAVEEARQGTREIREAFEEGDRRVQAAEEHEGLEEL